MSKIILKLYITGETPRSKLALQNIQQLLEATENLHEYTLDVINIFDDPDSAIDAEILATPTLIRELPLPAKRMIGDLSDHKKILSWLDIENE